uniref:Uncharacterized protein n=1 Tax=Sphaerodactylus townsendi TaxID=933632 RepID=A0ACB8FEC9_9SAUR
MASAPFSPPRERFVRSIAEGTRAAARTGSSSSHSRRAGREEEAPGTQCRRRLGPWSPSRDDARSHGSLRRSSSAGPLHRRRSQSEGRETTGPEARATAKALSRPSEAAASHGGLRPSRAPASSALSHRQDSEGEAVAGPSSSQPGFEWANFAPDRLISLMNDSIRKQDTSRRIGCPRPNCRRIINLGPVMLIPEEQPAQPAIPVQPEGTRVVCGHCGNTFLVWHLKKKLQL